MGLSTRSGTKSPRRVPVRRGMKRHTDDLVGYVSDLQRRVQEEIEKEVPAKRRRSYGVSTSTWRRAIKDPIDHITKGGGKLIRPGLLIATHDALEGNAPARWKIAAGLELTHSGSLMLDDRTDGSRTRRQKETVHRAFGDEVAITLGPWLAHWGIRLFNDPTIDEGTQLELHRMATDCIHAAYAGQTGDLEWARRMRRWAKGKEGLPGLNERNQARYFDIIDRKTGAVFHMGIMAGALLAGYKGDKLDDLGRYIGRAFQIKDDLLDFRQRTGKTQYADLGSGSPNFLVAMGLERANGAARKKLTTSLRMFGETQIALSTLEKIADECGKEGAVKIDAVEEIAVLDQARLGFGAEVYGVLEDMKVVSQTERRVGLYAGKVDTIVDRVFKTDNIGKQYYKALVEKLNTRDK